MSYGQLLRRARATLFERLLQVFGLAVVVLLIPQFLSPGAFRGYGSSWWTS